MHTSSTDFSSPTAEGGTVFGENGQNAHDAAMVRWTWEERFFWICLCALNLIPLWVTKYFPSQNGPWFLLPTHMFREYDNPQFNYSQIYVRNWHPVPHMLHDALVGLATSVFPILISEKLMLSLYVVLLPISVFYFLAVFAPGRRWLGYLSFLLVISYPFMRGYHDFTLSIPLYFITLAYWFPRRDRLNYANIAVLVTLGVLVYLSHLVVFALLAGSIGWLCLFEDGRWIRACKSALTVTWAGWLMFFDYSIQSRNARWVDRADTSWNKFTTNVSAIVGEYLYSVSELGAGLACAGLVWGGVWVCLRRRAVPQQDAPGLRGVLLQPLSTLMYFFIAAYFVAPYKVIGWHKANMRLLPLIYIIGITIASQLLPSTTTRKWRLALLIPTFVSLLGTNVILTSEIQRMSGTVEAFASGLEHVGENPKLLRVLVDNPAFGGIRPLSRVQDYYHIAKGGANGQSLPALGGLTVMYFRHYPVSDEFPDYNPEASNEDSVRVLGMYEYVLVWGDNEKLTDQLERASFDRIHVRDQFRLYRKRS